MFDLIDGCFVFWKVWLFFDRCRKWVMIFDIVDVFKDDLEIIVVVSRSSFKKRIVGKGNDEDDVFFFVFEVF